MTTTATTQTTTPTMNASRLIMVEFDYVPGGYEARVESYRQYYNAYRSRGESWGFNTTPEQMVEFGTLRRDHLFSVGEFVRENEDRLTQAQLLQIAILAGRLERGAELVLTMVDADGWKMVARLVTRESLPVTTCPYCGSENNIAKSMEEFPAMKSWEWFAENERLCDPCFDAKVGR